MTDNGESQFVSHVSGSAAEVIQILGVSGAVTGVWMLTALYMSKVLKQSPGCTR